MIQSASSQRPVSGSSTPSATQPATALRVESDNDEPIDLHDDNDHSGADPIDLCDDNDEPIDVRDDDGNSADDGTVDRNHCHAIDQPLSRSGAHIPGHEASLAPTDEPAPAADTDTASASCSTAVRSADSAMFDAALSEFVSSSDKCSMVRSRACIHTSTQVRNAAFGDRLGRRHLSVWVLRKARRWMMVQHAALWRYLGTMPHCSLHVDWLHRLHWLLRCTGR